MQKKTDFTKSQITHWKIMLRIQNKHRTVANKKGYILGKKSKSFHWLEKKLCSNMYELNKQIFFVKK